LNRRFGAYERAEKTLKTNHDIEVSREEGLLAAKQQLQVLLDRRQELDAQLAALEAQQKMVEVKKMTVRYEIDDSKVSEIQQALNKIEDKLKVDEKVAESEGRISVDSKDNDLSKEDLTNKIDQYFGKNAPVKGTSL